MKNEEAVIETLADHVNRALLGAVNGEVGIEVEVEGNNLPTRIGAGGIWKATKDNSLRGESMEYIFNDPRPRDVVDKYVDALFKVFEGTGAVLNESHRTSVHVHLNVSDLRVYDVCNIFTLYSIIEDFLIPFCGPQRKGNLFCLRMKDAQYVIDKFKKMLLCGSFYRLAGDDIRYAGLNLDACRKYGSVEFRAMRGLTTPGPIKQWVSILLEIKDAAVNNFRSPREMVEQVSMLGAEGFLRSIFSEDNFNTLFACFNEAGESTVQDVCYQGSRLMQEFAYTFDIPIAKARAMVADGTVNQVQGTKTGKMMWDEVVEVAVRNQRNINFDGRVFRPRGNPVNEIPLGWGAAPDAPAVFMDDLEPEDDDNDVDDRDGFEDDIHPDEEEDEE